ncbi:MULTISPECIES: TonB-dependent siderophore receptor [Delftia]|uniref:TonB-dependent siderophore receptor n=1 Tax=Delftia TaxID=80865 RepID=UPI001F154E4D|nr:TonB-dependent siderophore receptor [Delftia lacustris]
MKRARQLRGALGGQGLTAQTRHDQAGAQMCTARQGAMALLVAGAVAAMALPVPSQAQVPAQEARAQQLPFDIAAQPLATALGAFGKQSGQQVLFDEADLTGRSAQAVKGRFTPRQALEQLLGGSGMAVATERSGGFTLKPAPRPAAGALTLGEVHVTAQALRSTATEGTGAYAARAVSIGKSEQALKDTPQSVSVVTDQLMREQNITSVYEALASTTGITLLQSPQGGKYIYSRGLDVTGMQYDGIPVERLYGRASNYAGSSVIYDRVEVLRGATGLVQGGGDPSGAVNLVRKRPLTEPGVSVMAKAGSWDRYGAQIDASGSLNQDGTLRGRAVLDRQDEHSFIDYVNSKNTTLYGTLDYRLSADTQVSVGASIESIKGRPFISGLPRYSTGADIGLPRSTFLGADWNRQDNSNKALYADLSHQFNDRWRAKVSAIHVREELDMKYAASLRAVNPSTMLGGNIAAMTQARMNASGLDAHVTGDIDAFGRQHELVLGATYSRSHANPTYNALTAANPIDVTAPNAHIPEPSDAALAAVFNEQRRAMVQQAGVYGALRLQVSDPLKLVVGGRLSNYKSDWDTYLRSAGVPSFNSTHQGNTRFMPFAGAIYAINPQWNAYASYASIFKPQTLLNAAGENLKPIMGDTYEVGIKGELMDGRLNTSLALYRVNQNHRAQEDLSTSPTCRGGYYCYTDTGKVTSQGLDAEVSGELARGWKLFTGYTYNSNKYAQDLNNQGKSFNTYTPRHLLRAWTTYQLPGEWNAFTIGGGVNAQSSNYRQVGAVAVHVPGRAVWSSYVRYRINRQWEASLNFNNMFDKTYYVSVGNLLNSSHYGDPRNVMLTLRGSF